MNPANKGFETVPIKLISPWEKKRHFFGSFLNFSKFGEISLNFRKGRTRSLLSLPVLLFLSYTYWHRFMAFCSFYISRLTHCPISLFNRFQNRASSPFFYSSTPTSRNFRIYSSCSHTHKEAVRLPTKDEEEGQTAREKTQAVDRRTNLIGIPRLELQEEFEHFGIQKFRTSQIYNLIYGQGVNTFEGLSSLGKQTMAKLVEHYYIDVGTVQSDTISSDGTRKWLVDMGNNNSVESTC